jgi:hypothetical protein
LTGVLFYVKDSVIRDDSVIFEFDKKIISYWEMKKRKFNHPDDYK